MMMNSLLKRQIRKNLPEDFEGASSISGFLEAINKSYNNYEEQFAMLQRAMSISSQELFDANKKLREEAEQQQLVINSLTDAAKILRSVTYKKEASSAGSQEELTGLELASLIEKQALQLSDLEKQREQMFRDLEKSNEELTSYAQVVSHDLKSPLRNVSALVTWIKEDSENIDGTTLSHIAHIEKNLLKMDNFISGILEYSLIDKKEQLKSLLNLNELVHDTIESIHAPDAIEFTIDTLLPVVKMDSYRLRQLFQNLLSNAVKSIESDHGEIHIGAIEKEDHWEFYVKDNGRGIDDKYHQKIFQMFQSVSAKKESTGIGLSIVKKVIHYYGGKIWLTSKPGLGTTFYFTLRKD